MNALELIRDILEQAGVCAYFEDDEKDEQTLSDLEVHVAMSQHGSACHIIPASVVGQRELNSEEYIEMSNDPQLQSDDPDEKMPTEEEWLKADEAEGGPATPSSWIWITGSQSYNQPYAPSSVMR